MRVNTSQGLRLINFEPMRVDESRARQLARRLLRLPAEDRELFESLVETMFAIRGATANADSDKLARVSREMGLSTVLHLADIAGVGRQQ